MVYNKNNSSELQSILTGCSAFVFLFMMDTVELLTFDSVVVPSKYKCTNTTIYILKTFHKQRSFQSRLLINRPKARVPHLWEV